MSVTQTSPRSSANVRARSAHPREGAVPARITGSRRTPFRAVEPQPEPPPATRAQAVNERDRHGGGSAAGSGEGAVTGPYGSGFPLLEEIRRALRTLASLRKALLAFAQATFPPVGAEDPPAAAGPAPADTPRDAAARRVSRGPGGGNGERCSLCGNESSAGARYCSQCGIPMRGRCAACGEPLGPHARFCAGCGHSLGRRSPASAS